MSAIRTDLAMEAHAYWKENAEKTASLKGVSASEKILNNYPLTQVEILDNYGEKALGKPKGIYLTLDITNYWKRTETAFDRATNAVAQILKPILPEKGPILIAGLGNQAMTPDALGPNCLTHLLITRHLKEVLPDFREVAALSGGVLGTTGLEAAEWVKGVTEHVKPAAIILIDALAARELNRLCNSIQIADTGLIPGSGIGNHRLALNQANLKVPVISIGIPTVVDIQTIIHDITGKNINNSQKGFFVTPDSIDLKIKELAKILGYGINLALQPQLSTKDLNALLC
ncbi:MAG: GPR endopeptidase [Oscillospiraceae bacterium]|nr:GPR endopeptidase [Oscillospiraceae bacterium]